MAKLKDVRSQIDDRIPRRERSALPSLLAVGFGGLVGGALVYLYDPERGRARRAQARDRVGAIVRRGARHAERASRAASAQAYGLSQRVSHPRSEQNEPLNDQALTEKVKSELFRDASIPAGDLNINAERGVIVLRGQLDNPDQIREIEARVRRIEGVWDVQNLIHLPGLPAPAGTGA